MAEKQPGLGSSALNPFSPRAGPILSYFGTNIMLISHGAPVSWDTPM